MRASALVLLIGWKGHAIADIAEQLLEHAQFTPPGWRCVRVVGNDAAPFDAVFLDGRDGVAVEANNHDMAVGDMGGVEGDL